MKTFDITLGGHTYEGCELYSPGTYLNGSPAINLVQADDPSPITYITVNFPGHEPAPGTVWVRDWSEAEGLVEELERAGVATRTGRMYPAGFSHAYEMRLVGEYAEWLAALTDPVVQRAGQGGER